ncbi:hypothetical protein J437_LFUL010460, partial [Ladona fulva]
NLELTTDTLVILSADFRQTLPISPKSTPAVKINACSKQQFLWPRVKKNDEKEIYCRNFIQIDDGIHPIDCVTSQMEIINDLRNIVNGTDELTDKVYPNSVQNYTISNWLFESNFSIKK